MKSKTTTPPRNEEKIKSDKWTNIFFLKDGYSFVSPYIHPSEEAARNHAADASKILLPGASFIERTGKRFKSEDYSHAIQVPA